MNDAFAIAAAKINGEQPLLARDLDWSMTTPCGDCPFLKSSPFHEGVADSIPAYAEAIESPACSGSQFATSCPPNRSTDRIFPVA